MVVMYMRKRTKRKIRKFFRYVIFLLIIIVVLIIFLIRPGNPFTMDINLGDSKDYSKFEIRRVTFLTMKEFLKVPGKMNSITYNEKKSSHERGEWAKIYHKNKDEVMVFYIDYTTYKDASKKDYKNNHNYKASWVFVKDNKKWVFKSKK